MLRFESAISCCTRSGLRACAEILQDLRKATADRSAFLLWEKCHNHIFANVRQKTSLRVIPILTYYVNILFGIHSDILWFYLTCVFISYLAFYWASILTFYLQFYLAFYLTFFLASILTFCLIFFLAFYVVSILIFFPAFLLTFYPTFFLTFSSAFYSTIYGGQHAVLIKARDPHLAGGELQVSWHKFNRAQMRQYRRAFFVHRSNWPKRVLHVDICLGAEMRCYIFGTQTIPNPFFTVWLCQLVASRVAALSSLPQLAVEVDSRWTCPGYHTEISPQKGANAATWLFEKICSDCTAWKAVLVLVLRLWFGVARSHFCPKLLLWGQGEFAQEQLTQKHRWRMECFCLFRLARSQS